MRSKPITRKSTCSGLETFRVTSGLDRQHERWRHAGQHRPGRPLDTPAVIAGLKAGRIGYLGLDVYEEESDLFFKDLSNRVLTDDVFARLLTFPNVLVTGHQAFFTREAMAEIARVTIENIQAFEEGRLVNAVTADRIAKGHRR